MHRQAPIAERRAAMLTGIRRSEKETTLRQYADLVRLAFAARSPEEWAERLYGGMTDGGSTQGKDNG